ncbi:MAG: HemY protein [Candidatus Endobugula sp.]|jgi:HemY protein
MMRLFLLFCSALVVGGGLVYLIQQGSGYVLLVWGDTSVEMSLWFGLSVFIVAAMVLSVCFAMVRGGVRGIYSTTQKIVSRGLERAQQQTISGLIDFIEGDWMPAHRKLTRSAKKVPAPIINYLAAARCAYELGNKQEALQLLHDAEKSTDKIANHGELAIALTQARMQLSNQQFEQALAILTRAAEKSPNHNVVLSLQQQVYIALKDWDALRRLLPKLHQQNIGSVEQRYHLEQRLYRELFNGCMSKNKAQQKEKKYTAIKQCWKGLPAHFQQDEVILTAYANALFALQKNEEVESVLLAGLNREWRDPWVILYGLIASVDKEQSLKNAEKWLKTQTKNPNLLLTLGRLCLQNQQWGRAKDFLKESLSLQEKPETYAELARLYDFLGEVKESQEASRKGLLRLTDALVMVEGFKK